MTRGAVADMFTIISRRIVVVAVPKAAFRILDWLGAKRTVLQSGHQVVAHMHKFLAVYFTRDVRFLQLRSGKKRLPECAMVIVLPHTIHGWVDASTETGCGIVAHFHHGHPAHRISAAA